MNDIKTKEFNKVTSEMLDKYKQKNKEYNDSFGDSFKKYGKISALTRIYDKFSKLENFITNSDVEQDDDVLENILKDIATYCVMTAVELRTTYPEIINTKTTLMG